jgi:hypothetical protein
MNAKNADSGTDFVLPGIPTCKVEWRQSPILKAVDLVEAKMRGTFAALQLFGSLFSYNFWPVACILVPERTKVLSFLEQSWEG